MTGYVFGAVVAVVRKKDKKISRLAVAAAD